MVSYEKKNIYGSSKNILFGYKRNFIGCNEVIINEKKAGVFIFKFKIKSLILKNQKIKRNKLIRMCIAD